ncbi:MAG: preprotein translocase subunit YajC [Clostridia bacterium]|nr:preprotein translocase subunit YajC [Clostridia bacterium]
MINNFLTATNPGGQTAVSIVVIIGMVVVFYFMVIRPQKKQEKEAAKMLNELSVGDEITTIGGIIGEIVSIKDETVLIESSRDRTRIRILKSAIKNVDVKASEK